MEKLSSTLIVLLVIALNVLNAQDNPEVVSEQPPTTTIKFEETEYSFGKLKQGEIIYHEYKFTNTGNEPLVISNAKGSCKCAVPVWPTEPIAPGRSGEIMVEFNSTDKHGPQTKQFTITANTEPPQSILYIKGEVLLPDDKALIGYDREAELRSEKESYERMKKDIWRLEKTPAQSRVFDNSNIREYTEDIYGKTPTKYDIALKLGLDSNDFDIPETKIQFDEPEFVFGKIREGEVVQNIFRFVNTGKEPLKILKVTSLCGCTFSGWPKEPIPSGGSGAIIFKYHSNGLPGIQKREISILANTDPSYSEVYVKGEVIGEQPIDDARRALVESYLKSKDWKVKTNYLLAEVNPASSECSYLLTIEGAKGMPTDIEIFDETGQLVYKKALKKWLGQLKLDFMCHPEGTYWISLQVGKTDRFSLPFKVGGR
jgi:hypothetical protein